MKHNTSVILLAGGSGTRMQSTTPKQYLSLGNKPIACHSFELFINMPEIAEVIVVCAPDFQHFFTGHSSKTIKFALPGQRRQDSVYNGLQNASGSLICVHDAARPFIDREMVLRVLTAGKEFGAATVGSPIKFTIKEVNLNQFVQSTPDRSTIWEIQTPQVLHHTLLKEGFEYAHRNNITVTDDVSLAELIGKPVKLVEGSHHNLKITTPTDLAVAKQLLSSLQHE